MSSHIGNVTTNPGGSENRDPKSSETPASSPLSRVQSRKAAGTASNKSKNKSPDGGSSFRSFSLWGILRKNSFILLLLAAFVLCDVLLSMWDPMSSSRRFYKNDFTKTLYHHEWDRSGSVFYGNSAVTGAYREEQATKVPLVEMGLSYGKLTDLKQILRKQLYEVEGQLVVGIDAHTMLDQLTTDPTYSWFKHWYQPYVYFYRDYFKDSGKELAVNAWRGVKYGELDLTTYEPRWIDKQLYYGPSKPELLKADWERYEKLFNWMTLDDMQDNLAALDWVIAYSKKHQLPLKLVLMPLNPDPAYPHPGYWAPLKEHVLRAAQAAEIPLLDVSNRYSADKFHDLVHLNMELGAPEFTREVDAWLQSSASSSK
ncbi:MAG: hypothetical protein K0R67_139 [Paenibacillus sp.]|nr:hypothetical protein [Paenibacillus sp.]